VSGKRRRQAGFTLIEIVTVVAILSILLAIALPNYRVAIIQAREATLKEDLFRFREAIDQYQVDKGKYPASLETLVTEKYLRSIPVDPMTGATEWKEVPAEAEPDVPSSEEPGIYDVHSGSEANSLGGTPYSEW
jgi:general secretion pathway protein G